MSDNQEKLNEQLLNVVLSDKDSDEAKLKKIKYLVRLGADVNQKVNGKNLLRIAREKGYKEIENVIKESLRKSFDELLEGDKFDRVLDECGYAKGHKVIVSKQKAIDLGKQFWGNDGKLKSAKEIEVLIQQGADVNIKSGKGNTALVIASKNGYNDVVEVLLEGGADVHQKDNDGNTALLWAAEKGHKGIVEMLLQNGADVNHKTDDGWTALAGASYFVHKEVVEMLLQNGADVNIQNKCGMTALMWAAGRYRKDIVQMLLEKGADANIRNNSGRRVWDKSSREIIKVIKEHIKKTSGAPTNGGFLGKIFGGLTR